MIIIAVVVEGEGGARKYVQVRFLSQAFVFTARCFTPHPISPREKSFRQSKSHSFS